LLRQPPNQSQPRQNRNPSRSLNHDPSHLSIGEVLNILREEFADVLGADGDEVALEPAVSAALVTIASSFDYAKRPKVLVADIDFPTDGHTWLALAGRGVQVEFVRSPDRVGVPLELFARAVDERTALVCTGHVYYTSGYIQDVKALAEICHRKGTALVVDAYQSIGALDFDVHSSGVDFLVGGTLKWLMGGPGMAFLYARREVQSLLAPLVVSWGWPSGFIDEQQRQGTRDIAAFLAVPAAIDFLRRHNWTAVRRACHAVARTARARLLAAGRMEPLSADSPRWYAQMVSVPVPLADAERARTRLWQEFNIEAPIMAWNGRCLVRASIQGYNTPADVDALVTAVARLIAEEER